MKKITYVYALDLSLNSTGIAIFTNDGKMVTCSTIDTNALSETKLKLRAIGDIFEFLIKQYPPKSVVIEQGFTRYNKSTQQLYRVHGLVNYIFSDYEQLYYPASLIKKVVTGRGNASKEEVRDCILKEYPKIKFGSFDESDAFALGITHFRKENHG